MPVRPLVSKIRVHNPNKKGSSKANSNYLTYIATREGVSLDKVNDIDEILQLDGMMEKELNEQIIHQEANNADYLEYMARRPRSHGLFGNINTDDLKAIAREVSEISREGRIVYRGVISLSAQDAENLGYKDSTTWYNYLKKVMPDIAKELGVSSYNHTWVAAFHAEETHPHVHYELWDNKDEIKSPFIHVSTQKKIRKMLSDEMFDNEYEQSIKQVHVEELNGLKEQRNIGRKNIMELTGETLLELNVPGVQSQRLPDRPKPGELQKLTDLMNEFIDKLPQKGRLAYQFLPPEAKEQMQEMIDMLLERNDIAGECRKYLDAVERMHSLYGETASDIKKARDEAQKDVRKRIANKILKEIKPYILERGSASARTFETTEKDFHKIISKQFNEKRKDTEIVQTNLNGINMTDDSLEGFFEQKIDEYSYFLEWNNEYKYSMKLLYADNPDIKAAFDVLEKQAMNGNAIAINEVAKLIERTLVDVPVEESIEYYNEARKAFLNVYQENENGYIRNYAAYRLGKLYDMGKGDLEKPDYQKALEWYEKAGNNKYALYARAKIYMENKQYLAVDQDINKNYEAARNLFLASERQKNPFASYELGNIYAKGTGVELDKKTADLHYKVALEQFLTMSQDTTNDALLYRIGKMYIDGKGTDANLEEGIKYIKKASDLGNDNAKLVYAAYLFELNDEKMQIKAIRLLESMKENNMAQYKLGCIYLDRESGYYNMEKALEYLQKSAEQGNEYAEYKLGSIYSDEKSGYYNMEKALKYLQKSAEQGNEYAEYKLGSIYSDEASGCYDMKKALEYLQKSAEQGNEYAEYKLGSIYSDETSSFYDMKKALEYLQKSVEQGNEYAEYKLGSIYANEKSGYYDMEKALEYLQKSAEQGNGYAEYKLGSIYSDEESSYYNIEKALKYLEKSAEQGNEYAQCKLGIMYLFGKGVDKNKELGEYWLNKSAEQDNEFAKDILAGRGMVGINFTYCFIKGVLQSMEQLQKQNTAKFYAVRTQSKQARRENYLNRDGEQKKGTEYEQ